MNRKQLKLIAAFGLLVAGLCSLFIAFQLQLRYAESLDHFRSWTPPYFPLYDEPYTTYVFNYRRFFMPSVIVGAVSLIIAAALSISIKIAVTSRYWKRVALLFGVFQAVVALFLLGSVFYFREIFLLQTRRLPIQTAYDLTVNMLFPLYTIVGTVMLTAGLLEAIFLLSTRTAEKP